jgi:hypothetical protein
MRFDGIGALAFVTVLLAASAAAHATVVVSNAATQHMSCSAGVCTPTAKNAVLNAGDLQTMLASSDVKIATGSGATEIHVIAPVTWASANRLTLDAKRSIAIRAAVVSQGTGGVTITTNDGGAGGDLLFVSGGAISFWDNASSLIVNANAYTLVSDIATLASDIAAHPAGFHALAKDYDATGDGTYRDVPVPTALGGTFEGLGHAIANLAIDAGKHANGSMGLFAENDGTMRDVALTGAAITCFSANQVGLLVGLNNGNLDAVSVAGQIGCTRGGYMGGLAGRSATPAAIVNASANTAVSGVKFSYVGGLVGLNTGTIAGASAAGTAGGNGLNMSAGGLVGSNDANDLIEDSHSSVTVNAPRGINVGGLIGVSSGGTIERCSATGNVTAKNVVGGIVGLFDDAGIIDSSFATGTVTGSLFAGGIVGSSLATTKIVNSYATGAVTVTGANKSRVGGLAGTFDGDAIQTSWSSAAVSGGGRVGGVVGEIETATAASVYWDIDTSGVSNPAQGAGNAASFPGLAGLTTAQFKSGLPSGFDPAIWSESAGINNGYPYLIANPPQ